MADKSCVITMKLLIDTNAKRVLFAEANKECVDFLFHVLTLPVAALVSLLGKDGMVGSLPNLYLSVQNLNHAYIQPNLTKDTFLKPHVGLPSPCGSSFSQVIMPMDDHVTSVIYGCDSCGDSVSFDPKSICPDCKCCTGVLIKLLPPPDPAPGEGGFVKGVVTYMVMDDLVVKPMSTISSITLLSKFNVKEVGALEEKVVNLGMIEALQLLGASLHTKNVLTHVFLSRDNK